MFGRRKQLHPIHLYSAGMLGTKREPMTWMACPMCGYRTLESPYEPAKTCEGRWHGPHEPVSMAPADGPMVLRATFEACDGDPDLIRRTR
jgi:hypothetical protein